MFQILPLARRDPNTLILRRNIQLVNDHSLVGHDSYTINERIICKPTTRENLANLKSLWIIRNDGASPIRLTSSVINSTRT